ncbi:MAG TPA: hypothetical protein VFA09_13485 [Ktedonobacteraceae bacterium]|nr:hypothetical protein [Ktedonobacteraceae bacterium]
MKKEEEEDVLRITAQYVAEQQAGRQPRLSDYLLRYPRYASAITDFVTYYHAVEVDIPSVAGEEVSTDSMLPPLSENARLAFDQALRRVSQAGESHERHMNAPLTIQQVAHTRQKSLSQLAGEVGLSVDVLEKLARHVIHAATIPQEVLRRLSRVLELPPDSVAGFFSPRAAKGPARGIAEATAEYVLGEQDQAQSFREALEESIALSNEQKEAWREILDREGL